MGAVQVGRIVVVGGVQVGRIVVVGGIQVGRFGVLGEGGGGGRLPLPPLALPLTTPSP